MKDDLIEILKFFVKFLVALILFVLCVRGALFVAKLIGLL